MHISADHKSVTLSLTEDEVLCTLQTRSLLIHYKVKLSTSCTSVIVRCSIEQEWNYYISKYNEGCMTELNKSLLFTQN